MQLDLPEKKSKVVFLERDIDSFSPPQPYTKYTVITDTVVYSAFSPSIEAFIQTLGSPVLKLIIPMGESSKTVSVAQQCWHQMLDAGMDRKSCVIALGGGMITDLGGFVAACYQRGIDLINIPTTLLGMVDAAFGGKTGVNLEKGKNMVGAIHHPRMTLVAPHFLSTLPERVFRSGLAEVIKYGVIKDATLFSYLENQMEAILYRDPKSLETIIFHSLSVKRDVIREDLHSPGRRDILNWGHTFAHAIEAATLYETYLHGEAVSIGMHLSAQVGQRLGYAKEEFCERLDHLLSLAGLPILPPPINLNLLLDLIRKDKKGAGGKIRLIVAEKIGKVVVLENIEERTISEIYQESLLSCNKKLYCIHRK